MWISYKPILIYYDPRTGQEIPSIVNLRNTKKTPVRARCIHPDFTGNEIARYAVDGRVIIELSGNARFKSNEKITTYRVLTRNNGSRKIIRGKTKEFLAQDFDIQDLTKDQFNELIGIESGVTN